MVQLFVMYSGFKLQKQDFDLICMEDCNSKCSHHWHPFEMKRKVLHAQCGRAKVSHFDIYIASRRWKLDPCCVCFFPLCITAAVQWANHRPTLNQNSVYEIDDALTLSFSGHSGAKYLHVNKQIYVKNHFWIEIEILGSQMKAWPQTFYDFTANCGGHQPDCLCPCHVSIWGQFSYLISCVGWFPSLLSPAEVALGPGTS